MYIPRDHFAKAYNRLKNNCSAAVPSVLILTSLEIDSLCACRMLQRLLKSDFIPHKMHPVAGYQDLSRANEELIANNEDLRFLILLGVGGMIDLIEFLSLRSGIETWLIESRRPWNLQNVFGGPGGEGYLKAPTNGQISGEGGVVCWDDGDIAELMTKEEEAFKELIEMPEVQELEDDLRGSEDDEDGDEDDEDDDYGGGSGAGGGGGVKINGRGEPSSDGSRKRKSSDDELSDDDSDYGDSRLRKRINSGSISADSSPEPGYSPRLISVAARKPPKPESPRARRRRFMNLRRKHTQVLVEYYSHGTTHGEPISSLVYSLASELGREENELLWLALVGWEGQAIYGRSMHSFSGSQDLEYSSRGIGVWGVLRDEVRRLNPPPVSTNGTNINTNLSNNSLHTTALSPTDNSLRLSSEFRFLLIRHWSLYDSMLHSPYLGAKLHIWSEAGRKRLHKLLATMGFSLQQCRQNYTHMDMDLKRGLRDKLDKYAGRYGLDEIVREGVVRCWGWKACLSAGDVSVVVGSILELGKDGKGRAPRDILVSEGTAGGLREPEREAEQGRIMMGIEGQEWLSNFHEAYDALEDVDALKAALPTAMHLHRAILATGTSLIERRQIKHLRTFRVTVVKEGPDMAIFTHPSALTKLALWVAEAIREQELEHGIGKKRGLPLVVAALNEWRGVYVVVGTGTGANGMQGSVKPKKAKDAEKGSKKAKKKADKKAAAAGKDDKEKENREPKEKENGEEEEDEEAESDSDSDSDSDDEDESRLAKLGRNRFGIAFQEVANETAARVRIDSFEACVVEVRKEDLQGFLESLSMKAVS